MGYRETPATGRLRELVETAWTSDVPTGDVRVLPDGCMDLLLMRGRVIVAGPDTGPVISPADSEPVVGLRFRPGILPRLLGVPAHELRDLRVPLDELVSTPRGDDLVEVALGLAARPARPQTSPWSLRAVHHVTARLAIGAPVSAVADEVGWSNRTLQRQSLVVYGYGPAMLRRVLRFRRAVRMMRDGLPAALVAAEAGYADQPHLHRDAREFSGVPLGALV
ncbi:helix-turn-helix domain-containing protein [Mycolicibacterium sediminis]|uniref:AraC family transcriptional regulator n=1 Tax=Mycolicibacterium sediminis TaxID=1286180 RepID=A0A7I7QIK6_9MYCO|nr:helix-turn-helix domain-containing protein [Mycolicibacterium sediminis]BBY26072.1 AraC family transcriptional regulator [Mycolicibacterium sediminis]